MTTSPQYHTLVEHYDQCFAKHGATPQGVDWPNAQDVQTRFDVMLGIAERHTKPLSLLDLGCGYGALYDYLLKQHLRTQYHYQGIDLSIPMIAEAKKRHAGVHFEQSDILRAPLAPQTVDITIMNGVLTEKRDLSHEAMETFALDIIGTAYDASRVGVAFNVMSTQVDYERDDLFHWSMDRAATLLQKRCSRHIVFRADYGLYEYTTYIFRDAYVHL